MSTQFSCPRCRPPWRRARSPSGSSTRARRSRPATSSPRSRPTRRPWRWRRSMRAGSKILVPAGTENVKVNTPIALIDGEDGAAARSSSAKPASPAPTEGSPTASEPARTGRGVVAPAATKAIASTGLGEEDRHPRGRECARRAPHCRRARDRARHRDGHADRARSAARRHGRGDAARPGRVPHGRGGGAVPGRLQDQPGPAWRSSATSASSTRPSPSRALPASASARRWRASSPSSSS